MHSTVSHDETDMIQDYFSLPVTAATQFLDTLTSSRKKATLLPILTFINSIVSQYPAQRTPKEKDGALRMIGSVATTIIKSVRVYACVK